jgi:indole-3-glycerol phosphate synthase
MEVMERKAQQPATSLEKNPLFTRATLSLRDSLLDGNRTGIIAEFKRKSPSKGVIHDHADVSAITAAYTRHGASGISVLTDEFFFGGSTGDLITARENVIPILRKDFIIDEYQLIEARAMGADVVLLIAACLSVDEVKKLSRFAKNLGLEILLEVHDRQELGHLCDEVDLLGVNNRDLKTFSVDINKSLELIALIPSEIPAIAESGISDVETIRLLRGHGFRGFLVGENFMKEADPAIAFASFVNKLKTASHEGKSMRHDTTRPGKEAG